MQDISVKRFSFLIGTANSGVYVHFMSAMHTQGEIGVLFVNPYSGEASNAQNNSNATSRGIHR